MALGEVSPNRVIEEATHRVADFLPCTFSKRSGFAKLVCDDHSKPFLNRHGFDGSQF
jgi:hypothetical protein